MTRSAFGVVHEISKDDYRPGAITYHQEQANLHSRKKTSGRRQVGAGTALVTGGAAAGAAMPEIVPPLARRFTRPQNGPVQQQLKIAYNTGRGIRHGQLGAAAAIIGGAGLAATGVTRLGHHGHQQNRSTHAAQDARRSRNVSKSAFGVMTSHNVLDPTPRKKALTGQGAPAMTAPAAPAGLNKVKAKLAPMAQPPTNMS